MPHYLVQLARIVITSKDSMMLKNLKIKNMLQILQIRFLTTKYPNYNGNFYYLIIIMVLYNVLKQLERYIKCLVNNNQPIPNLLF